MTRPRNLAMVERIESAPVAYPIRFVVAGDSGAWPDPTADAIYAALVRQVAELEPPPLFLANLGDFAGPGTPDRHEHYHADWGFKQRRRSSSSCCGYTA